jgi:hypothetical protein
MEAGAAKSGHLPIKEYLNCIKSEFVSILKEDDFAMGKPMNSISLFSGLFSTSAQSSTASGDSLTDLLFAKASILPQGGVQNWQTTRQIGEFIDSLPATDLIGPSLGDIEGLGAFIDALPASDFIDSLPADTGGLGAVIDALPASDFINSLTTDMANLGSRIDTLSDP